MDSQELSLENGEEVLKSLNLSRKKSEKDVRKLIAENELCHNIRNLIINTINCSKQQIEAQKLIIDQLRDQNDQFKKALEHSKQEQSRSSKMEKALYGQIQDQQIVKNFG
jgi:uncharacterized NAD(P)/FAD-binding protein YdhS